MSATDVIARLRELRAKATAGPWSVINEKSPYWIVNKNGDAELGTLAVVRDVWWEANAGAIVAAMNSLESLLECAEALAAHVAAEDEALAEWPLLSVHPWTGDEPAMKRLAKARAALEALGKVGGA